MGTKVFLRVESNVPNPSGYFWLRACNGVNPWLHNYPWVVPQIDDCLPSPGNQTYRVWLTPQFNAQKVVKFREPDMAKTTISGMINMAGSPQPGQPTRNHQIQKTKLTWHGQPLGPCAQVCYKENVKTTILIDKFGDSLEVQVKDFPATCVKTVRANQLDPNEITMDWDSPYLYDRIWHTWDYRMHMLLQFYSKGTPLATRTHKYDFYGDKCGVKWIFSTEIRLKCIVDEVLLGGQPVPLPNSIPPRNLMIARWVIESQSP